MSLNVRLLNANASLKQEMDNILAATVVIGWKWRHLSLSPRGHTLTYSLDQHDLANFTFLQLYFLENSKGLILFF
jgi:hypothetical protein